MESTAKTHYGSGIDAIFKNTREKAYQKHQIISYQGDNLASLHFIKSGFVKAYTILDSGDTRTLLILGPGDLFPVAFSLTMDWGNYQVRYFYQTLSDVKLSLISHENLRKLIENDPLLASAYMSYMSGSNEVIMNQLEAMKHKTAKDKLVEMLPYVVKKLGKKTGPHTYRLQMKLSHQEIADLSGITRETTSALLKDLEKVGVVQQQRDTWIIHLNSDQEDSQRLG